MNRNSEDGKIREIVEYLFNVAALDKDKLVRQKARML
jgi:hypothetical protein